MLAIFVQGGTSGGVTSFQVAPASRLSRTVPSSVPIQIVSFSAGARPMEAITP
jgi:hypothetical protein